MKNKIIFYLSFVLILFPHISLAAVNLPWSTTYNCADWTQSNGLNNVNCDGLTGGGDWTTSSGNEEQITAAANYSGGGGGRGQRQWNGDGTNNVSGGTRIAWTTAEPELWVRWYMRYENGYTWATSGNSLIFDKWLYFDVGSNHYALVEGYTYFDQNRILSNYDSNDVGSTGNGWDTIMSNGNTVNGHKTSDGQWHCYEVHIKMDTGNAQNGTGEIWIDDTLRYSKNSINYSGTSGVTGWTSTLIGSNQAYPLNGRDVYVDFDDITISATGRIGCLGTVDTPPPTSANSAGSSDSGGGSGCGFVKDSNGKESKAKGEGLALIIMLVLTLAGIALAKKYFSRLLN